MVHQSAAMPLTSGQVSFTSASSRADRACLERAGRSQPANGRLRHSVGAGHIGLHSAFLEKLRELRPIRPSAAHFLGVNLGCTRGMQLRILAGQGLAIGADPGIAVNRHFEPSLLAATYALKNYH